jgi:hypothetical protein
MRLNSKKRRGKVIVLFVVCLPTMMGFVAISLEGGLLLDRKRSVQAAADAAALAAAADLYSNTLLGNGLDASGTAKASVLSNCAANGYSNDGVTSTVTVNIPPKSGTAVGQPGYAEVVIQSNQQRGFSAILGSGDIPVRARAVARGQWATFAYGIIALDPHAPGAFTVSGNGPANVTGSASIIVNSDYHPNALSIEGNGGVSASAISVTGGYQASGSGRPVPTPTTGVPPMPDPLAYLTPPDPNSLPLRSTSQLQVQVAMTLQPGVYRGGIVLNTDANVIFSPGIYYLDGGGLTISGNGSVTGTGIMIYNAPKSTSDQIVLSGNGSLNISPMTTGIYQGISIFQDRNSTAEVDISGNGGVGGITSSVTGTVYAANALVYVQGNGSLNGSQLVSRTIKASANGGFNMNFGGPTAKTRWIGLVE